ncbi:MAG: energy-coupling factor transporter ATPase [Acholeplasma sp.]|jgi:energy-coupling factor transport system ATP-binding protein|nr:energy-coupling factor transporter ATPase [Acholeplasma sp.]
MGIQFNQVSYFYRGVKNETYEAINQISVAIHDGEFVAICGQTGSGKTTLVQHMNALLKPTRGTVQIYEHTLPLADKNTKIGPIRKKVGLVFQFPEYQLFEETILKDIMFGPLNFGLSLKDAEEKARHAAALVGLDEDILQKSPFRISGGQMRRVAIAGILAMEPEMLVLDEPTRGLDPKGSDEMMALFNELHEKHGKTIVLITHDMDIVARYAKRILVMDKGKIKFDGTRELLFMSDEFEKLHLAKPQAYRMMEYLSKTLGYPFKQIFTEEDLIQYLKEVRHE